MEYSQALKRAQEKITEKTMEKERIEIPRLEIFVEGNETIILNFKQVVDLIRRDPKHIMKFFNRELASPGQVEGQRAIIQRKLSENFINQKFEQYVKEYVVCNECRKIDTHFEKIDRVSVLRCEACGAHRPIKTL